MHYFHVAYPGNVDTHPFLRNRHPGDIVVEDRGRLHVRGHVVDVYEGSVVWVMPGTEYRFDPPSLRVAERHS